ncbi:CDP-glycerol glycerophosphotransferase family protein [Blastococcus brunescens]|uniref:CDP-glycerol glycerophosphotransferase family protein n=1 Tax=Blastococcus brunescens TaxID=1564165 RepID=A0ABZ1B5G9_9ACTN|nr:CDP-glycerol glycerophosphotransferase family protein [Blastococcus sp. BMG 8361]WRL65093.1 CDP-glycerol glycerophosphotransferase family protein [Blastococcus sp. BMG 8361]
MKAVYFTYRGLYADNPRAIYRALRSRGPADLTHTWLCTEKTRAAFPPGVDTVLYGSSEAADALATADIVVANDCMSMHWEKRPGATYLQTWHGTPLKRIHHDAPVRPGWLDKPDRDVARWDALLSPNAASTDRLRHAFRYGGPIHETGYPRNDVLMSPDRDDVRRRVRGQLGLSDDTTAVLYAPTWRDDLVFDSAGARDFEVPVDLDAFADRLGGDHVLLLRLHSMVSGRITVPPGAPVIDVSDVPEPAELYLAADVLVTDYSSAMFDFAVTGKPMVFYTYDLEHYRDDLRGFYFDLTDVAPGPIVRSSEELLEAIADSDVAAPGFADRYARFRDTFCSLEDGHATDRVLDLLLPPSGRPGRRSTSERG